MKWSRILVFVGIFSASPLGAQQSYSASTATAIAAKREIVIDGSSTVLDAVTWISAGPKGALVVASGAERAMRFIDAAGGRVTTVGRSGEGPGEFRTLGPRGWNADTLWVLDPTLQRISSFTSNGKFLGVRKAPFPLLPPPGTPDPSLFVLPELLGRSQDGESFVRVSIRRGASIPQWAGTVPGGGRPILRVGADGQVKRMIGWSAPDQCVATTTTAGGEFQVSQPFCMNERPIIQEDGHAPVLARGMAEGAGQCAVQLTALEPETGRGSVRRVTMPAIPIPARVADSARAAYLGRAPTPQIADAMRKILEVPKAFPCVRTVIIGITGDLWLQPWGDDATSRWLLVSRGRPGIRALSLPRAFRGISANETGIIGVEADADGSESVVRYRVP
ncbi:MAG: hypothetical protein IPG05_07390 [Gemmatimonadetes bacterium]|nr:hypothetical protein [Gemmatimonadota bacterium]